MISRTIPASVFYEIADISSTTLSTYNKIIRKANGIKTPKHPKYISDL